MPADCWKRYLYGSDEYCIEYRTDKSGKIALYCTDHPTNRYSDDPRKTHIFEDKGGKLCVAAGREPRDFEHAEAIAFLWMQGYSQYVRTGEFGATGGCVDV